jgi:predicted RNA-binding Zn-ribbon protein involved in translation (DUF1610 family)
MEPETRPASVTLKCPNCGANLSISPEADVFACGYCGAQQIVRRDGGTVSLKLIGEAVAAVKAQTDLIARELKLSRLKQDLAALDKELEDGERNLQKRRDEHRASPAGLLIACVAASVALASYVAIYVNDGPCCFAFLGALFAAVVSVKVGDFIVLDQIRDRWVRKRNDLHERREALSVQIREHHEALDK